MDGQWPKYDQSAPRPKSSPLGSKAEVSAAMDSLHDIHALVKLEDYEDVKNMTNTLIGLDISDEPSPQNEEVADNEYLKKLQS